MTRPWVGLPAVAAVALLAGLLGGCASGGEQPGGPGGSVVPFEVHLSPADDGSTQRVLLGGKVVLDLPGWSAHVVMSGSMEPRINIGDVVLSQGRGDYQPGQVIVFDSPTRGGGDSSDRVNGWVRVRHQGGRQPEPPSRPLSRPRQ